MAADASKRTQVLPSPRWHLLLLPAMAGLELALLFAIAVVGLVRPRTGLALAEWFDAHLPDRAWYWGMSMNRRPDTPHQEAP